MGDGHRDDGRVGVGDLGSGPGPAQLDAVQRPRLREVVPRRTQRGAAVVDIVLVMVVLVPVVLGILQVALVLFVRNTLAAAASEGARLAATRDRGPADGAALTRAQIDDAVSGRFARDVTASQQGQTVEVTVH